MNFIDSIHQHATARPDDWAVITPQGKLSWAQIDCLLWATAARFHHIGLREGDRVGISMLHPVMHLVASLALARLGVGHIALPVLESAPFRASLKKRLALKCVMYDRENIWHSSDDEGALLIKQLHAFPVDPEQKKQYASHKSDLVWLILQSSGTTGLPKFAELSHTLAFERFQRFRKSFNCSEADIFWPASRMDFVVAKQRVVYSMLAGAAVCIPEKNAISAELVAFFNKVKVTMACGTPSHMHQLLAQEQSLPSLRIFEARSSVIHETLRQAFKQKISPNLYVVYGTNEGDGLAAAAPVLQEAVPRTVGLAADGVRLEIVDEQGLPMAAGHTGEIRVQGPGIVGSYIDDASASAKSFEDGWFYPGDLGYLTTEGALVLQGRNDDMMIVDGMNVYPAEIETALMSHPAVQEAAAFPIAHRQLQDYPVAAVTLRKPVDQAELIAHCKKIIGTKYPGRILILKEFPRNAMGKILKRELKKFFFDPMVGEASPANLPLPRSDMPL